MSMLCYSSPWQRTSCPWTRWPAFCGFRSAPIRWKKPMITSAGSWKTSCCSSLRSGRPLNPPTRIPPTKSGCSTAARRRWCRRCTWKNGWKPSQRKKYDKYGSGIPAHEGIPLFRFSEYKFLSGKIDFSGCLWDNRTAKSENTRYKRGFHP